MSIPYAQHVIGSAERAAVLKLLDGGWLARGPVLAEFESAFSQYTGSETAISCSSGSAALEIVLRGLDIGPGDEVIVPNITWVSTATAVNKVGGTPVFCDVAADYPNLCPTAVEAGISSRTKAVIAVHFAGVAVDMTSLSDLCKHHSIELIEDAAHAVGGSYEDGTKIGSSTLSSAACFSFHPAKNMTTGEGGMVTTQDEELGVRMSLIRSNGISRRGTNGIDKALYDCLEIGDNYHLNCIAAAIGLHQIERLDGFVRRRAELWSLYSELLVEIPGLRLLRHPRHSAYNLCLAFMERNRDEALAALNDAGIGAYYHYPLLHELSVYQNKASSRNGSRFDNSLYYRDHAITLPLHPALRDDDVRRIANVLTCELA